MQLRHWGQSTYVSVHDLYKPQIFIPKHDGYLCTSHNLPTNNSLYWKIGSLMLSHLVFLQVGLVKFSTCILTFVNKVTQKRKKWNVVQKIRKAATEQLRLRWWLRGKIWGVNILTIEWLVLIVWVHVAIWECLKNIYDMNSCDSQPEFEERIFNRIYHSLTKECPPLTFNPISF